MFADDRDQLDPRANLPAHERRRLREMAASVVRRAYRELLETLGLDDDAVWRAETDRDERGWTDSERCRFELLVLAGWDLARASESWRNDTRTSFVAYLVASRRIGVGDEVTA